MKANWFSSNLKSGLISLVMALLTWIGVNFVTSFEQSVENVALDLRLPDGWAVEEVENDRFTVWFRGSRDDIGRLESGLVKVELDLRGRTAQESVVETLSARNVQAPGSARVFRIEPDFVKIRLDSVMRKPVPVKPQLTGVLPAGYEMDSAVCVPEAVELFGSRRRLGEVSFVQSTPVDLNGRIQSFETNVDIVDPNPGIVERLEPRRVKVLVSISSHFLRKDFAAVPVRLLMPPASPPMTVRIEPPTLRVRVEAGDEMFRDFSADKILSFVAPTGAVTGPVRVPVQVRLPTGMSVLEFEPKSVILSPDTSQ